MKRVCTFLVMLFFVLASVCPSHGQVEEAAGGGKPEASSDDLYHTAIKNKAACEAKVLSIKDFYEKDSKEYRTAANLYTDAMAKYNALFEMVKLNIQSGTDFDVNKYEKDISDAYKAGEDFLMYAGNILNPEYGFAAAAIVTLVPLFDLIFKTTRDARDASADRKKEMLSYMDSLKWKPFQAIEATK